MFIFINKGVGRSENRTRANFPEAVHVIENLNISDNMVSAQVRAYADLDALKFDFNAGHNDGGKVILDRHFSYSRQEIQSYVESNSLDMPETLDPFVTMKASVAHFMVSKEPMYKSAMVGFESFQTISSENEDPEIV